VVGLGGGRRQWRWHGTLLQPRTRDRDREIERTRMERAGLGRAARAGANGRHDNEWEISAARAEASRARRLDKWTLSTKHYRFLFSFFQFRVFFPYFLSPIFLFFFFVFFPFSCAVLQQSSQKYETTTGWSPSPYLPASISH
jgi:hypothetical protein